MLETGRGLASTRPLRNDVVMIFTDGEEAGLLGASSFVAEHPLADRRGVILNWEATRRRPCVPPVSLELLALGARFKGFFPPFVGKEPGAYHLNAELVRTFWDHKGHANGTHNPGADGRLLAYAAKALCLRGHESLR